MVVQMVVCPQPSAPPKELPPPPTTMHNTCTRAAPPPHAQLNNLPPNKTMCVHNCRQQPPRTATQSLGGTVRRLLPNICTQAAVQMATACVGMDEHINGCT